MNWEEACQILGVPVTANEKEIHAQYIYKAQLLHPDKTAGLPETVRQKAEDELKRINAAYNILKDLKGSPQDYPPKITFSPESVNFHGMAPGEKKTATVEINDAGGPYTRFWVDDSPAPWLKVIEARSITGQPLPLEITLEATAPPEPDSKLECTLPVRLENETTGTRDETGIDIELKTASEHKPFLRNIFGPGLKNPFSHSSGTHAQSAPAWHNWLKSAVLVLACYLLGVMLNGITGTFIPLPLLVGSAVIFSIDRWHRGFTARFKIIGPIYKLALNLIIISLLVLIVWTAVQLYNENLSSSFLLDSFLLAGEIVTFLFIRRVFVNNSWRRPKLVPTMFLVVLIVFVMMLFDTGPLAQYNPDVMAFFERVYEWAAGVISSMG